MNEWQVLNQIVHVCADDVWPGDTDKTFGHVDVSSIVSEELLGKVRFPALFWRPGSGPSDIEIPGLVRQQFLARLYVRQESDALGKTVFMGAHRVDGKTSSKGRGLLEVQERLTAVVGKVTGANGAQIVFRGRSRGEADVENPKRHVGFREYAFEGLVGHERVYQPGTRFAATNQGGGAVLLAWTLPPDRFDFYRMKLRRAAGSTPPATHTAGTAITLADPAADTSVTDTPGAGTWSYALFALYDDAPWPAAPATELEPSPARTLTQVVT